ncbi:MAG: SH3 domain-containing protein [Lachnospiraceae bacterium]|nr:SH3 domain-containing protein [Lachnospiraceae bacterium]
MANIEKHLEREEAKGGKGMETWMKILLSLAGVGCIGVIAFGIATFQTVKENEVTEASKNVEPVVVQVQDSTVTQTETEKVVDKVIEEVEEKEPEITYTDQGEVIVEDEALAAVMNSIDEDTTEAVVEQTEQVQVQVVEAADFVVEDIEPCQLYAVQTVNMRKGPDANDFDKVGSLKLNEKVTVVGIVKSYKGEPVLWYKLQGSKGNTAFVSGAYLAEKEVVVVENKPAEQSGGTPAENQQSTSNQEIANLFNNLTDGNIFEGATGLEQAVSDAGGAAAGVELH